MKLIIMRGLPGSGKSTLRKKLTTDIQFCGQSFSTDTYWERPDGIYDFNFNLLGKAHQWNFDCFSEFVETCANTRQTVIIDNTNITYKEFRKYIEFFCSVNEDADIVLAEPKTEWAKNPQLCFERNTHGVPLETIQKMLDKWQDSYKLKALIEQEFSNAVVEVL